MIASSNTDKNIKISEKGIIQLHAYTFLNATEIKTKKGEVRRVVQLRNPLGKV